MFHLLYFSVTSIVNSYCVIIFRRNNASRRRSLPRYDRLYFRRRKMATPPISTICRPSYLFFLVLYRRNYKLQLENFDSGTLTGGTVRIVCSEPRTSRFELSALNLQSRISSFKLEISPTPSSELLKNLEPQASNFKFVEREALNIKFLEFEALHSKFLKSPALNFKFLKRQGLN